jgi:hypothetical protein
MARLSGSVTVDNGLHEPHRMILGHVVVEDIRK